ncbi:MAG: ABC transporter substrate-binding protein [Pseudomonadota bacterium]
MNVKILSAAMTAFAMILSIGSSGRAEIVVGGISNRTAATSDASIPHMDGVLEAWGWINANGGIDGEKVKVIERECGYNVPKTLTAFKRLVAENKVPLIHGFGTPDSLAVIPFSTRSEVIYMPVSYATQMTDAKRAPYFFMTNAEYGTGARSAVQFVKKNGGNLALFYNADGFGQDPIPAVKDEARKQGVQIVEDVHIGYMPADATKEVEEAKKAGAKFIWMGNTDSCMAVVAKALAKQKADIKIIGNVNAGNEAFIKAAGKAAEGHYAIYCSAPYGSIETPAMKAVMAAESLEKRNSNFIRGWAQAMLAAEAMRRCKAAGRPLTGPNLKWAFETMKDYSPDGLVPPVTFTPDDHRPNMSAPVFQVQDGKWVKVWDNTLPR